MKTRELVELENSLSSATREQQTVLKNGKQEEVIWLQSGRDMLHGIFFSRPKIIYSSSPYYYKELVRTKHATYVVFGLFKGEPEYRYHYEARFNSRLYEKDLANANKKVSQLTQLLETKLSKIENEVTAEIAQLNKTTVPIESERLRLHSDIRNLKAQIEAADQISKSISLDISKESQALRELLSKVSGVTSTIASLKKQVTEVIELHSSNAGKIGESQEILSSLQQETENADGQVKGMLVNYVESISEAQRADLLMKLWFTQDKTDYRTEILIKAIVKQGFDANYLNKQGHDLVSVAVVHKDEQLFELVLEQNSTFDFELPTISGGTLLEYSIKHDLDYFTSRILKSNTDFSRTMIRALTSNNLEVLDAIFAVHPDLTSSLHQGHSFLQLAVIGGKIDIVHKLLEIDKTLIDQKNFKKESTFKLALKSGNQEIITELLRYVDANEQIKQLASDSEIDLLTVLFEAAPNLIDELDSNILYQSVQNKDSDLSTMLLDYGTNIGAVLEKIFADEKKELLLELYKLDPDYLTSCKTDKKLLTAKIKEYGYESIMHDLVVIPVDSSDSQGLSGSVAQYSDHSYGVTDVVY